MAEGTVFQELHLPFALHPFKIGVTFPFNRASIRPAGAMASSLFNKENIYIFGGVGIRFIHKYIHGAVLRIDYGFSLKHSQRGLTFGIGQFF